MSRGSNPFLVGKHRPIVVGHRGVPKLHQENTLAGFRRAVELGLPAIELDVRLTRDRKAVVLHDHNLRRLTGSTFDVDDLTWDQISRLRIRRALPMGIDERGKELVMTYEREERIPLLSEVLSEVSGRVVINIELKLDVARLWATEIGAITAQVISEARAEHRVIVTSFDPRKLGAAIRKESRLAVGFCFDDTMLNFAKPLLHPKRMLSRILESNFVNRLLGTKLVGAEHTLIGHRTVERLHAAGVAIGTHTLFPMGSTTGKRIDPSAMTDAEAYRLVELGVDWIESDDPERLQALIG
jgi:glycerophosphoryl diester phosphodiesterase